MVRDPKLDNNNLDNDSFYLSKPLRANFQININKIMSNFNLKTTTTTTNNSQDDFTFLQPFQAERIERTMNNLKALKNKFTNTLRTQPYTLSKPNKLINNDDNNDLNKLTKKCSKVGSSSSSSSSNAILARLNSMSSSLKSMFNKSKNGYKIDISSLSSKKVNENKDGNKSLNNSDQENQQQQQYLKINESVNDYLINLSTNPTTTTTASSFLEDKSYLNDRIKKLSKEYDELIKTNQQQQQHQQNKYIKNYSLINDSGSSSIQSSIMNIKDKLPKWTCMICLNKNRDPYDAYCSICGSAKTSSSNRSYASSNSSSITRPTFPKLKENIFSKPNINSTLISPPSSASSSDIITTRKISKTWKCQNCDYANDNLKIVCVNCRTPKNEIKINLKDQALSLTPQIKRKVQHDTASVASSSSSNCSSSYCGSNSTITITKLRNNAADNNDSNENINQPASKRTKDNCSQLCINCHQTIEKEKNIIIDSVTPTKPAFINFDLKTTTTTTANIINTNSTTTNTNTAASLTSNNLKTSEEKLIKPTGSTTISSNLPSLADLFKKKDKWNCKTCLAENSSDKNKCACCETPKESNETGPKKPVEITILPLLTNTNQTSLSDLFGKKNKWSCKTCLVENNDDKIKCVCCETPKDSSTSTTKTDSSSVFNSGFASKGITFGSTTNKTGDTPKFGLQGSKTAEPIVFSNNNSFIVPSTQNSNSTLTLSKPAEVSKTPSLVSVPTIILSEPSTTKAFTFGSGTSDSSNTTPKISFGTSSTATTTFPKFGQTTGFQIGENKNNDKINVTDKTIDIVDSKTSPTKASIFGSGSIPNNTGLDFSKSLFKSDKTNIDNSNNFFSSNNKSENDASKQSNTGFFSTPFPSSTTTSTNNSFGSIFGSGFNNNQNNNNANTNATITAPPPTTNTNTSTPSIFGSGKTTGLFGTTPTATTTSSNTTPSIFGSTTTTQSTAASSSNMFSSSNTSTNNPPPFSFGASTSGGLFGNQQTNTSGSLFNTPTVTTTASSNLFGSNTLTTTSNSNPFGNPTTTTTNTNQNTFTFGNKTPFGSLSTTATVTAPTTTTSTTMSSTPAFGIFNTAGKTVTTNGDDMFKNTTTTNGSIFNPTTKPSAVFGFGNSSITSSTLTSSQSAPTFSVTNNTTNPSTNTNNVFGGGFGAPQTTNNTQQTGSIFAFGQTQAAITSSTNTMFTFGSSTPSSTNIITNDHQAQKRTNDQQQTQQQKPQQQPTPFNFNQTTTPSFNFSQPNMNFTSTPSAAPFVFGDQQTNNQPSPRMYKKPTRKLTKK